MENVARSMTISVDCSDMQSAGNTIFRTCIIYNSIRWLSAEQAKVNSMSIIERKHFDVDIN